MVVVDDGAADDGLPPAALWGAFDEQNTSELRRLARQYAKSRVRYIRDVGQPIPRNYATELVNDALTDTRLGIVRWNPASCSLLAYICGLIRARTAREVRRGRQFPRISLHGTAGGHAGEFSDAVYVEHPDRKSFSVAFVGLVFQVAIELKVIAEGDATAQALLSCWHAGIIKPEAVMARTGLTLATYKATRKRLLHLSKRLSPELTEAARELLRSAS